jgi:hypothetical protein
VIATCQYSLGAVAKLAEAGRHGRQTHDGDVDGCCVESRRVFALFEIGCQAGASGVALSTDRTTREKAIKSR